MLFIHEYLNYFGIKVILKRHKKSSLKKKGKQFKDRIKIFTDSWRENPWSITLKVHLDSGLLLGIAHFIFMKEQVSNLIESLLSQTSPYQCTGVMKYSHALSMSLYQRLLKEIFPDCAP